MCFLDFLFNVFLRDLKVVEYLFYFELVEKFIFLLFIIINLFLGDLKIELVVNFFIKFVRVLYYFKIVFYCILKVFECFINFLLEILRLIIEDFLRFVYR